MVGIPWSLRVTVPLILMASAAILSAVNLIYHVPRAERLAEEAGRERLAQEMSRLQSTLEYLLLKGDQAVAKREITVLAHNHDYVSVALTDERNTVIAATRQAWLERQVEDVLPQFDRNHAAAAIRERGASVVLHPDGNVLLGYAGILLGSERRELRPTRIGSLFIVYDLARTKAEARRQVLQQSFYWAGWVIALALGLWLVFHFLLSRRTARLVHAAERLAAGDLDARSMLAGRDELGRLGRAFDAMAIEVAETQTRLRRDIAERVRVQQALEHSEEEYRAIFNASIDGLALWNAAGRIVDVNPAFLRLYGYTRDEFVGLPANQPLGLSHHKDFLLAAAAGERQHAELTETRADGASMLVEVNAIPMQYQGRRHVLTIARDVTEERRAAEELARQRDALHQREKMAALGSLLAGVAHELNNPLSVVVARSVLLEEQGHPSARAAALKIRAAAERCARIVRTFLAMARQQQPQRGPVAINDVVSDALDITAYAIRTSSIETELYLAPDIPTIRADADQLHQVLLNLLINAQQALQDQPAPRRIRVRSRFVVAAGVIRIDVDDNGPGIPREVRARVFDPYFTTKPTGMGTGVGLAVSSGIVEAHGGRLTVECPAAGGSVFTVELPVAAMEGLLAQARTAEVISAGGCEVLVVDDEAEIRDMLVEILAGAQHRVATASSGREALERLACAHYDVILTDIRMPDLDGRALYQEIERRWPERVGRVVFVTGDTLASALREFAAARRCPVIEKPFVPNDVRRVVAETAAARVGSARP